VVSIAGSSCLLLGPLSCSLGLRLCGVEIVVIVVEIAVMFSLGRAGFRWCYDIVVATVVICVSIVVMACCDRRDLFVVCCEFCWDGCDCCWVLCVYVWVFVFFTGIVVFRCWDCLHCWWDCRDVCLGCLFLLF